MEKGIGGRCPPYYKRLAIKAIRYEKVRVRADSKTGPHPGPLSGGEGDRSGSSSGLINCPCPPRKSGRDSDSSTGVMSITGPSSGQPGLADLASSYCWRRAASP